MYMNLVMLAGFLGRDAVAGCVDNGNFTILELVIDLPSKDKESNEYALRSESDDVIVFGGCGEDAAIFKKGDYIIVTGELRPIEHESECKQQSYTIWVTKFRWAARGEMAALKELNMKDMPKEVETE
jgi:single-stranded DNA-binding protein